MLKKTMKEPETSERTEAKKESEETLAEVKVNDEEAE